MTETKVAKKRARKKKVVKNRKAKIFDDEFISQLPEGRNFAALQICKRFINFDNTLESKSRIQSYETYLEALGCLMAFAEAHGWDLALPTIDDDSADNIERIRRLFYELTVELKEKCAQETVSKAKKVYSPKFGEVVYYEFSDDDFARVQKLINELRELISKSKDFKEDHKRRLLKKLEKLQEELHKKMSSLDMLWGLIGDAGVALGKLGENAKPLTDRIGEILQIVCRTQAKAENVKGTLPLRLLTGEQTDEGGEES